MVVVVRAWVDSEGHLRIRLLGRPNAVGSAQLVAAAGSIDESCAVLRRWLTAFHDGDAPVTGG